MELLGSTHPYIIAPSLSTPPGEAVKVEGGVRVSGTWKWATGIMHADWVLAVALLRDGDGPSQMRMVLFPAGDAQVLDTWHADGMAGTGSNDVRVTDLFVPDRRVLSDMTIMIGRGPAGRAYSESVWTTPMLVFATVIAAAPALGAAKAAVKAFQTRIVGHIRKGADVKQMEKPAAQLRLAKADLMVGAAETIMREAGRRAVSLARIDMPEQTNARTATRAQLTYAVSLCRKAVLHLAEGAGSSVHMLDEPFQRAVRDICLMSSHVGFDVDAVYELHGRALVGLPPNSLMARCLVPESRAATLTREGEEALWQAAFTAQPERRREFEPSSKRRKKRAAPWPSATA